MNWLAGGFGGAHLKGVDRVLGNRQGGHLKGMVDSTGVRGRRGERDHIRKPEILKS